MKINCKLKISEQFSYVDDEFKELLKEVCDEIDMFDGCFPLKVGMLSKLPYELTMMIVENLKYDKNVYHGTLNTIYFDEFKSDIKKREQNRKSKFQNRQLLQKSLNYELFVVERLLTVGELKKLLDLVIAYEKLNISSEDLLSGKIKTENGDLKILLKAHKLLSDEKTVETSQKIMRKLDKVWLKITLNDIKKIKSEKGLLA